ncbi:MAG: DNA cytosine methyltransferase [Rhodocyclaceae bacterium]|nr:DNA cytosine methyltransferase [Rhodocyclaceae bacterium]
MKKKQYKVASLFSGIGGFELGFESAGFKTVFQCEKDAFCQKNPRKALA